MTTTPTPRRTRESTRPGPREVARIRDERNDLAATVALMQESLAELQLAAEDVGWIRVTALAEQEFTREGLARIAAACRVYAVKNPLIVRGLQLRQAYIWGQGVEIGARATGKGREGEQDVNAVVRAFLDDPGNRRALTGAEAQLRNERSLFTDGNVFIVLFTRPLTGAVQARIVLFDEIQDIIYNPQDRSEPWYYLRRWQEVTYVDGVPVPEQREAYYPAVGHRPQARPRRIGAVEVLWDSPVVHVRVNDSEAWRFGIGDAYPALDWSRAYKEFLEAWATLVKSLSRFAWRLTSKQSQREQARNRVAVSSTPNATTGQVDVGGTAIIPPDALFEPIPKTGAVIDASSGQPLAVMVAAALSLPITMLLGDPGITGARATAETLDNPTERVMEQRRQVWAEALRTILGYAVNEAVRAPQGPLRGTFKRDPLYDRETVTLAGDTDPTIDITFPDIDDIQPTALMEAIERAAKLGVVPPELVLRWILTAMGERNIDQIVDALIDEETGEFRWPGAPPVSAGQRAADTPEGEDPADAADGGRMTPDPDDPDNSDDDEDDDAADRRAPAR